MSESLIEFIANLYGMTVSWFQIGQVTRNCLGTGKENVTAEIMGKLLNEGGYCSQIADAVAPIGIAFAFLFFFISLISFAQEDKLTIESLAKFFVKLIIPVALIYKSNDICRTCIQFGNSLASMIDKLTNGLNGGSSLDGSYNGDKFAEKIKGFMESAGYTEGMVRTTGLFLEMLCGMLFVVLIALGCFVIMYIICFSRVIEMAIRMAFMPIAIGLMADDGWRGSAGRYIKKFLSLCAQASVLTFIGCIMDFLVVGQLNNLINTINETNFTSVSMWLLLVGIAISGVMACFKSIGIVNDIFGA